MAAAITSFACDLLIPSCGFAGRLGLAFVIIAAVSYSHQHHRSVAREVEVAFERRAAELKEAFDEYQGGAWEMGRRAERRRHQEEDQSSRSQLALVQDLRPRHRRGN
ncbi:hypothetical protein [Kribbella deserti]|uniref:Uncharacterized protein n=1 Tax=Kribbella deserti TaxID=1926257 RepID=A0ABV6QN95_9ACTN